jgi:hypothetical protein
LVGGLGAFVVYGHCGHEMGIFSAAWLRHAAALYGSEGVTRIWDRV